MLEGRRDLAVTGIYGCLAAAATWFVPLGDGGGLLLAPMVLCPGYPLARAIAGRHRRETLELAVLTVTLSFATAALGGLLLNVLGVALTARTWSVLFLAVTGAGICVAAQGSPGPRVGGGFTVPLPSRGAVTAGVVTCGLLAAAGIIAWHSERRLNQETSVTQLAAVRASGASGAISVYVRNTERATGHYRLEITAGKKSRSSELTLAPGATWSKLRRVGRVHGEPVAVRLFRTSQPSTPSRSVIVR